MNTRPFVILVLTCLIQQRMQAQATQKTPPEIVVPARTAFCVPDARAMRRYKDGSVTRWKGRLEWFGRFQNPGGLEVVLKLEPGAKTGKLRLEVGAQQGGKKQVEVVDVEAGQRQLRLGSFEIRRKGYHRIALSHADAEGNAGPGLQSLILRGPAVEGAHFSLVERRNAASVHLGYPVPKEAKGKVEWFYCEVTPKTDPLWTYYEATGWHRGYFGMQVNSPKERRIIFSVWDAGKERVSRKKVARQDLVQLVAKGEDVHAGGFGHEGTGGHSHLVYDWKPGLTYRFLLHAKARGSHTTYTGWFWFPEKKAWGLIASFKAPRDGKQPRGLYSFIENFGGANGQLRRVCEFGNQWVRTTERKWLPLLQARFTHDGHGRSQRLDRSAGILGDRFYLANGGFVDDQTPGHVTKAYSLLTRKPGKGVHPADAALPSLGH